MSDILLDSNGDIDITNNELSIASGVQAIKQHIIQQYNMFLGEWFLDLRTGIPYLEQILIKNFDPVTVDAILKGVPLNTPGITRLDSFDVDFEPSTRQLSINFQALASGEEIDFSEIVRILI